MRLGANKIFFLAVLGSLAVHVILASIGERVVSLGGWTIPAEHPTEFTVVLPDDEIDKPKEPEKPKPSELTPPEFLIGDAKGTGYASFDSPGVREQLAKEADSDQAFLSRDPRGQGTGGESTAPETKFESAAPPAPDREKTADVVEPVFGPPVSLPVPKGPRPAEAVEAPAKVELAKANSERGSMPVAEQDPPKTENPKDVPTPTEEPRPALQPPTPPPAPPQPVVTPAVVARSQHSADPAPQTESEVDAFSKLGSVELREGRLSVRAGRQIKPRRPKFTLAGEWALRAASSPRIELAITIDANGHVTSTEILKSSGSVDIDQPVRVSLYDWWFEPKKDATGKPVPDRFKFDIAFR